jgi:hypothetical protein
MRDLGHGRFELFDGADGRAWLGARYQQVTYRPWRPECEDWSVAVVDDEILLAFNREDYFRRLIGQDPTLIRFKNSTNLSLNSGDMVAATAGMFDCSDWLKDWVQTRVSSDQLNRRPLHGGKGREPQNYRHPADEILALFGDGQDGQVMEGQKLAELVGWSAAEIDSFRTRIEVLKLAAATARVEADRANASELARPILAQRTRDSLLALAVEWQAPVRRSAKKAQIIEALVTDQDLAERLIGL